MIDSLNLVFERYKWSLLFIIIVLPFLIFDYSSSNKNNPSGLLTFAVLDIGQGDSIYIESPTGTRVIIDGGPGNNLLKKINDVLPINQRYIDLIVVTNPDSDHYEGFIKFLDQYEIGAILESGTYNDYLAYKVFQEKIKLKNIPNLIANRGQKIDLGGEVFLEILFPDRDVSTLSPNDGSIVMKLVYKNTSIMLQGDSTSRIEQYLLSNTSSTTLKSNIIKVGHHGSRTSSYVGYVKAVNPEYAIISSGKNNEYNHPHKEVLENFNRLNIKIITTCNNGNIIFKSDGQKFSLINKDIKPSVVGCKNFD